MRGQFTCGLLARRRHVVPFVVDHFSFSSFFPLSLSLYLLYFVSFSVRFHGQSWWLPLSRVYRHTKTHLKVSPSFLSTRFSATVIFLFSTNRSLLHFARLFLSLFSLYPYTLPLTLAYDAFFLLQALCSLYKWEAKLIIFICSYKSCKHLKLVHFFSLFVYVGLYAFV